MAIVVRSNSRSEKPGARLLPGRRVTSDGAFIYALVCPLTLEVKYVGQTAELKRRFQSHLSSSHLKSGTPLARWIDSLTPTVPGMVILETVEDRRVQTPKGRVRLSSIMEAKWIKRFHRTVLNRSKQSAAYDDLFVDDPVLRARYGL